MSGSGCSSELVSDTVYVINFPQYELALEQLLYPINNECTDEHINVSIRLHNYGYDTIPAGASLTCVMNTTDTITDIATEMILPGSDYTFTFTPQLTIPFPEQPGNHHGGTPPFRGIAKDRKSVV